MKRTIEIHSTSERMPEPQKWVLGFYDSAEEWCLVSFDGPRNTWIDDDMNKLEEGEITHWFEQPSITPQDQA